MRVPGVEAPPSSPLIRSIILGAASGALMALSMPPVPTGVAGWICLFPLLLSIDRSEKRYHAFLSGLVSGIVFFTACTYWTALVMVRYGDLTMTAAAPIAGLLILYLSLFPALATALAYNVRRLSPRLWPAAVPFLWVGCEYLRTRLFTGFPWCLLGYSQHSFLAAAQIASVGGVYMVSALLALGSTGLYWLTRRRLMAAIVTSAAVIAILGGGTMTIRRSLPAERTLRVGIVQPCAPPLMESRPELDQSMARHLELTQRLRGVDLIVWPENSLVRDLAGIPFFHDNVANGAAMAHAPILVNSVEYAGEDVYNSAILVYQDGRLSPRYDKIHLVPFGEYVPIKKALFFANKFLQEVSDFSPGTKRVLFDVKGRRFATAICYEIIYPGEVAAFVRGGAEFLVTQSNDSWYGKTVMPYQHQAMAVFRAIENRRYLVRATNSGISSIVDPAGRVVAQTRIGDATVLTYDIRPSTAQSLYTRSHDAFAVLCLLIAVMTAALPVSRLRKVVD